MTHFGQSRDYVFSCDVTGVVRIKLIENGIQFFLGEERLDVKSCSQELCVINLMVSEIVDLIDYFFYLFRRQMKISLLDGLF